LGEAFAKNNEPSITAVVNNPKPVQTGATEMPLTGRSNARMDEPQPAAGASDLQGSAGGEIDYLDIPAFLRRQAD
jgi:hypothetical protein